MDPHLILGLIIGLPVLLFTILRVNAAIGFLALCLGALLGSFVVRDAMELLRGYVAPNSQMTESVVAFILLWLPVLAVLIFMMTTISGKQRGINLIPALAVGLVGALVSVPFLTPIVQTDVYLSDGWQLLESNQALIVTIGTIASLLLMRMRKPIESGHKGKRH